MGAASRMITVEDMQLHRTSLTNSISLSLASAPTSGSTIVAAVGSFFGEFPDQCSVTAPSGLAVRIQEQATAYEILALAADKVAGAGEGTTVTGAKAGAPRSMALAALVLSGCSGLDVTGSHAPVVDVTALSVASDAPVASAESLAVAIFFRRARTELLADITYSNGFVEIGKAQSNHDSQTEVYIATKTVEAGAPAVCEWASASATIAGMTGLMMVYPPAIKPLAVHAVSRSLASMAMLASRPITFQAVTQSAAAMSMQPVHPVMLAWHACSRSRLSMLLAAVRGPRLVVMHGQTQSIVSMQFRVVPPPGRPSFTVPTKARDFYRWTQKRKQ